MVYIVKSSYGGYVRHRLLSFYCFPFLPRATTSTPAIAWPRCFFTLPTVPSARRRPLCGCCDTSHPHGGGGLRAVPAVSALTTPLLMVHQPLAAPAAGARRLVTDLRHPPSTCVWISIDAGCRGARSAGCALALPAHGFVNSRAAALCCACTWENFTSAGVWLLQTTTTQTKRRLLKRAATSQRTTTATRWWNRCTKELRPPEVCTTPIALRRLGSRV